MTPALKVMVEAMAAEFERQGEVFAYAVGSQPGKMTLDGEFDLEKVARAGLAAIKPATTEVIRAVFAPSGAPRADLAQHEAIARDWNTSIGAILGEKP